MTQNICFIGAGNMATALVGGLLADGRDKSTISACDIDPAQLERLEQRFGIATSGEAASSAGAAAVVMLAVKPQVMRDVCTQLAALPARADQLFISIAAGVPAAVMDRWLGGGRSIVRCMPNTPAMLQLGASALFANPRVSAAQKQLAENIMQAVGIAVWIDDEAGIDAVTAISGSGPAYFFYFIELLEAAGTRLGLAPRAAARLARQTALGAATMAQDRDVAELRAQVTSEKGTTEQAILSFQHNELERLVNEATAAAYRRSQELAQALPDAED